MRNRTRYPIDARVGFLIDNDVLYWGLKYDRYKQDSEMYCVQALHPEMRVG